MNKILIIGKVPPPIGGVTIHVSRLLDYLEHKNFNYTFYNNHDFNIFTFLVAIWRSQKSHIHVNNPFFLFVFTIICKILNTYSIITIHQNVGCYGTTMSIFELLAIKFSNKVIVLNQHSYDKAIKLNPQTVLMSAFIFPIKMELLDDTLYKNIVKVKEHSKIVFCTNASRLSYDKSGCEIYGITELVDFFALNSDVSLVISDPSGDFFNHFRERDITISKNITMLLGDHPFIEVIKASDCLIRNTTTDGDSLSIKEAMYFGKKVIATNCVVRPEGVFLYGVNTDKTLSDAILAIINNQIQTKQIHVNNGADDIFKLYDN